jgi:hypothetical protein
MKYLRLLLVNKDKRADWLSKLLVTGSNLSFFVAFLCWLYLLWLCIVTHLEYANLNAITLVFSMMIVASVFFVVYSNLRYR